MGRLEGKVAAVSGGASGIGEATVRLFVEEGARVAFADRDSERGARVASEIKASGGDVLFVEASMEREVAAAAFVQRAVEHFGRLDILVNNAGIRLYQTVVEASEESWDSILGVNVKGYAFCAKAAIPAMRRTGGGSIVNVASIRAVVAGGNMVQYDTTKAAVAGLTRAMARDHAADNIRVNAVCPGPIFTPFHERRAAAAGKSPEAFKEAFGQDTMLKRAGTPREVAACILFLASEDASYVTGTCLFVDGGQTAQ
jgi:NAD(P)-dependent dehydrogenase (short-subunit alcohol dehydrogenase family)